MNKLLKLTAAGTLLTSSVLYGQIEINDNLSVTGFLDMSATDLDSDRADATTLDLDQMEIDFLFAFDQVTGQVDIDHERGQNGIELEQAFITYDLGEGTSFTAGKFLSYHGWETAEPTGLYQYSYAYRTDTLRPYHNGVSLDYNQDWGSLGIAVLDSVYDDDGLLGGGEDFELGLETKLVLTPADGWTVYLGYGLDSGNQAVQDRELINFWTSYEVGIHTFAVEYNDFSGPLFAGVDEDITQWLAMYSAAVSDKGTVTVRLSDERRDFDSTTESRRAGGSGQLKDEDFKYTVAYIHTLNDNLALVSEVSYTDMGTWRGDETLLALEALFTF